MPSTLRSLVVASVLGRLHAQADDEDSLIAERIRAREAEIGHRLTQDQRYELCGEAPLSITPEVGQFLYLLALSAKPRLIVEFGSSLGVSTIYLAAAVPDRGSEIDSGDAERATELDNQPRFRAQREQVQELPDLRGDRQRRLPAEFVSLVLRKPMADFRLACADTLRDQRVLVVGLGMEPSQDARHYQRSQRGRHRLLLHRVDGVEGLHRSRA